MKALEVVETVTKQYKFLGLPVMGTGTLVLEHVKSWLICNWEGYVVRISKQIPHVSDFAAIDKGGLSIFGVNAEGYVNFGISFYPGDKSSNDPIERNDHYYCKLVNCANGWPAF